jgi:hypothetical protein
MRDTQSIAFFRPPGIDQLYSGETMIRPSAPRMASAHFSREAGRILDIVIVDRELVERRRRAQLQPGRRQCRQGARQRRVVRAFAQRAADHQHIELLVSHVSPPSNARVFTAPMSKAN